MNSSVCSLFIRKGERERDTAVQPKKADNEFCFMISGGSCTNNNSNNKTKVGHHGNSNLYSRNRIILLVLRDSYPLQTD